MTTPPPKVRVRFAPSPTGYLHIGGLRTGLYNYLFAKKNGGDFILRIEDTDQARFVEGATDSLIVVLDTMDITYTEGIFSPDFVPEQRANKIETEKKIPSVRYPNLVEVGDYGPYVQSERLDLYKKYAEQLVSDDKAYYCFCDAPRLEAMRAEQIANKTMPKYDRHCCTLDVATIQKNLTEKKPFVIRLKVPDDETVTFDDAVRGEVKFHTSTIDDQILMKSDGYATYHLANVVDDHLMRITHVIRGEEWLPSTPKHILLYRAFGWGAPVFAHLPLLLNPDKSKLSKRQGDVAVEDYLKKGYLVEALINFVALLGWNPGEGSTQEIFQLGELVEQFDMQHIHKGGAVFDTKKLDWLNAQYIKALDIEVLLEKSLPFFETKEFFRSAGESQRSREYIYKVLTIEQDRLAHLDEVGELNQFFFITPPVAVELLPWKSNDTSMTVAALERAKNLLEKLTTADEWTRENLNKELLSEAGEKKGDFLWPMRVALTGAKYSPSPSDVAWVLGRGESLQRIQMALDALT
ncbi:MAG: glutamate--tRNA ligase [Candidatus Moraniibacteriota bacterium]